MKIITTINFMEDRLLAVKEYASINGIYYKDLIRLCVKKFIESCNKGDFKESSLKYQADNPKWKKVHFKMDPSEYDVYFDCKKVLRWSFSLIVAVSIDLYLESVLNEYQEFSYPTENYVKICIGDNNYPIYLFSWNKTEKIDEIERRLRE
jgi:hypothetical protein